MDGYPILDPDTPRHEQRLPLHDSNPDEGFAAVTTPAAGLRFPGDDSGRSLSDMAQRDLEAALQLLTERAQYITGASGAAIALREAGEMICRASAGPSAPELGSELRVNSGLTGESVRAKQLLRCDDVEMDARVNQESCRALGIKSVMVMPLLRDQEVIGVFELLADRVHAFEERDVTALERLAEMTLTAVEHADAANRALNEIGAQPSQPIPADETSRLARAAGMANQAAPAIAVPSPAAGLASSEPQPAPPSEITKLRSCEGCGFPVSEGRTLCLDCEAGRESQAPGALPSSGQAPAFLAHLAAHREETWLQAHMYTIGTAVVAALTVALLWLRLR